MPDSVLYALLSSFRLRRRGELPDGAAVVVVAEEGTGRSVGEPGSLAGVRGDDIEAPGLELAGGNGDRLFAGHPEDDLLLRAAVGDHRDIAGLVGLCEGDGAPKEEGSVVVVGVLLDGEAALPVAVAGANDGALLRVFDLDAVLVVRVVVDDFAQGGDGLERPAIDDDCGGVGVAVGALVAGPKDEGVAILVDRMDAVGDLFAVLGDEGVVQLLRSRPGNRGDDVGGGYRGPAAAGEEEQRYEDGERKSGCEVSQVSDAVTSRMVAMASSIS